MPGSTTSRDRATVAVVSGGSIENALQAALEKAGIAAALRPLGDRGGTRVVIKPVLAPTADPAEPQRQYAAPRLVEALAEWVGKLGWPHIAIAVSGPHAVDAARRVGYKTVVDDLSRDTDPFHYGGMI